MRRMWASDDEVTKYLTWPTHSSVEMSRSYMEFCINGYNEKNVYQWGIELKNSHELIGNISVVKIIDEIDSMELGWVIGGEIVIRQKRRKGCWNFSLQKLEQTEFVPDMI